MSPHTRVLLAHNGEAEVCSLKWWSDVVDLINNTLALNTLHIPSRTCVPFLTSSDQLT